MSKKTPSPDWLHQSVRTVKCGICGSYITERWDYKAKCWHTDHVCTWRRTADRPAEDRERANS